MKGCSTEAVIGKQQIDFSETREGKRMMKMMKRKEIDVDDVSDDLHDFSLSSSARKIRRLNAQLPPIMEEEREQEVFGVETSAIPEEKAIVLYKPFLQSPTSSSLSVSFDLISGFKKQLLRNGYSGNVKLDADEQHLHDENDVTASNSLAVVPWFPSQFQLLPSSGVDGSQMGAMELMEADDIGETAMDIEENNAYEFGGTRESDNLNQWQQQHCMMPQLPQSTSTPVTWSQ